MKRLLPLLLSSSLVLSQTDSTPPVSSMTPEMMTHTLNANPLAIGGAERGRALVKEAIDLGRLDLMKACFLNGHVTGDFRRAVVALPDNELRRKAAIMMLRNPSTGCWPHDDPHVASFGIPITGMIEPVITTVSSLLPGEALKEEMVATKAAREKLADRLLAALIAQGTPISAEEKTLLEAQPETAPIQPSSAPSPAQPPSAQVPPAAPAKLPPNTDPSSQPQAEPQPRHLWWLTGGALVLMVLAWKVLKKRS